MSEAFRARKAQECALLRSQAQAAEGVGRSLHSLAPVVGDELRAIVSLKVRSGRLRQEWLDALASVDVSALADTGDRELAACAALLMTFADEARKRIASHGNDLVRRRGELEGKAAGVEATVRELDAETTASPPAL